MCAGMGNLSAGVEALRGSCPDGMQPAPLPSAHGILKNSDQCMEWFGLVAGGNHGRTRAKHAHGPGDTPDRPDSCSCILRNSPGAESQRDASWLRTIYQHQRNKSHSPLASWGFVSETLAVSTADILLGGVDRLGPQFMVLSTYSVARHGTKN